MSGPEGGQEKPQLKKIAGSKKGVKYVKVIDLFGSSEAHSSEGPVDTVDLLEYLHIAQDGSKTRRKRGKRD